LHNLGIVLWAVGTARGVIGAALAGNAIAQSGLRPLARLTGAAEHIARTEDLRPIPVTGSDEISRLAQAFNAMLAALAQSRTASGGWSVTPDTSCARRSPASGPTWTCWPRPTSAAVSPRRTASNCWTTSAPRWTS
jgi:HAMP domain-containing protein